MKLSIVIPTRRPDDLKECLFFIKKYTKDYEVILINREAGIAEKINEGISKAKGDYIVLLHDDIKVQRGWADELTDVGTFKLGEYRDEFDIWGGFINGTYCQDPKLNPDYSFFLCLSKKVIKKIGKFDEWYQKPYCQDIDMGMQVKKAGYKIKCLPGKIIHMCGEGSITLVPEQREYLNRKWLINVN